MSKPFTYWVRLATVATLCTLTTFNPVLAGKCIERLLKRDPCKPATCVEVPSCEVGCIVPACPPVPVCQPAPVCSPAPACPAPCTPCDGLPMVSPADMAPLPSDMVLVPALEPNSVPIAPDTKVDQPKKDLSEPTLDTPRTELPKVVTPADAPPVKPQPKSEPPKVEQPKVEPPKIEPPQKQRDADPFDSTPLQPSVKPVEPMPEQPADLFDDKPALKNPPTEEKGLDDLFDNRPAPATEPDKPANNSLDDLFGAPADGQKMPEGAAVEQPAEPAQPNAGLDDLFGSEKPVEPAPEAPAKSDGLDDLFGAEPNKPVEKAADGNALDGLFDDPKTPADPAPKTDDSSLDDLFGKPVSTEANEESKGDDFEALFPASETPATNAPVDETPSSEAPIGTEPTKDSADPLDVLFGVGSFQAPDRFHGAEFQTWVDNTGTYTVKARLAVIYGDRVKLLKENGKFTTVPLNRLSEKDFGYVQWVASNLTMDPNTKFVKKDTESSESDSVR